MIWMMLPKELRPRKKYGKTFLTKVRWRTKDKEKAEKSIFQYGCAPGHYTLSLLGVLNGLLMKVGLVLYVSVDKYTRDVYGYKLERLKK